jgi:hypothetical protein
VAIVGRQELCNEEAEVGAIWSFKDRHTDQRLDQHTSVKRTCLQATLTVLSIGKVMPF